MNLLERTGHKAPIAVFDSGLGGLTVVAELLHRLPAEDIVYFGDTARVPYGTKSGLTVTRFALENATFLMRFDPKLLVIACNTAAAAALQTLRTRMPVPVCGVVEPGAVAAICQALRAPPERIRQGIAVLATESTVNSRAYPEAIRAFCPRLAVVQQPCPLLVPLAEEGRTPDDPVVRLVLSEYLRPMQLQPPAAVLLGCTHYPLFAPAIAGVLGGHTPLVDSARAAVRAVVRTLAEADLLSPRPAVGTLRCYVSDNAERFSRVGSRFLGRSLSGVTEIALEDLQTHDLPGRPVLESLADCPAS